MITYVPNSNSGKIRKIKKNENYHNLNICNKNSAESVCSSGQYKKEEIKKNKTEIKDCKCSNSELGWFCRKKKSTQVPTTQHLCLSIFSIWGWILIFASLSSPRCFLSWRRFPLLPSMGSGGELLRKLGSWSVPKGAIFAVLGVGFCGLGGGGDGRARSSGVWLAGLRRRVVVLRWCWLLARLSFSIFYM